MRSNLSSSILQRVLLNTLVQQAGHDLPFLQVLSAHQSQNTPCHCFTAESRQIPGAQGCWCLVLAAKWGFHCCLCCHRGHPKPGAKHATDSPWVHPKQYLLVLRQSMGIKKAKKSCQTCSPENFPEINGNLPAGSRTVPWPRLTFE